MCASILHFVDWIYEDTHFNRIVDTGLVYNAIDKNNRLTDDEGEYKTCILNDIYINEYTTQQQ